MVQVNRVYLKILFINRPQFLVDSNDYLNIMSWALGIIGGCKAVLVKMLFVFCFS